MLILYSITIFTGAALLFLVQPMVAKLVLPLLGGSPAVWNTCMVFFQAALLGGYLSAHLLGKLRPRIQVAVYSLALAAPIAAGLILQRLIVALPTDPAPPESGSPIGWLLALLAVAVGGPFLILSAAGPLLQKWFAGTGHPAAKDPYFLYAASNTGSMLALLGYPLLLEPTLPLGDQRWVWSVGFGLFAVMATLCGLRYQRRAAVTTAAPSTTSPAPTWRLRLWWVFLAFVPSSLMLGATQFISTDIAAVPLLWVIPLAIYLLTFILAFSTAIPSQVASVSKVLPILLIGLAVSFLVRARHPITVLLVLHLLALFLGALLCHGRLAAGRPHPSRLTEFYLLIAVGGVLGGLFNALLAPVLFNSIIEYPIALGLALLARPASPWDWWDRQPRSARLLISAAVPLLVFSAVMFGDQIRYSGLASPKALTAVSAGLPAILCYLFVRRPVPFSAGVAVILVTAVHLWGAAGGHLVTTRTFFGVYHVSRDALPNPPGGHLTTLTHGTTVHGLQSTEPGREHTPLGYYHPDGPIGQVFRDFKDVPDHSGRPLLDHVGLVGLGTGALATYGEPGRRITFHEIDPAVVAIAENPQYFTYLRDCKARYDFALGDGRLTLARVPDGEYGLILLDAFSSDAIPIHLITREAAALYLTKLKPGGLLAFHISNQYLELAPVLARIAADLDLAIIGREDEIPEDEMIRTSRFSCTWILLARRRDDFGPLLKSPLWRSLTPTAAAPLWTDDYSNILSVFQWQ